MNLTIQQMESNYNLVLISDQGEEIIFDFKEFKGNIKRDQDILFLELNGFWGKLSPNRREQIFTIYKNFHETTDGVFFDESELYKSLTLVAKDLMSHHTLDELTAFVKTNIQGYPDTIQRTMNIGENLSISKTYTWDKYNQLVALSITAKAMAPLWAFYLKTIEVKTSEVFKDLVAYKLLARTWIPKSKPIDDLLEYIKGNINFANLPLSAQVNGLGEADMPGWLLAITLIRRLMLRPLMGKDVNLVIDVFKTIKTKSDVPVLNRLFKGKILRKDPPPSSGMGDDDQNSIIEDYKIKEVLTTGDRIAFATFAKNVESIAVKIDEDIDLKKVRSCFSYVQKRGIEAPVEPFQKRLTQWVLSSVMSPRAVETYRKDNLIAMVSLAQAVLWQWGFNDIALMMTGVADIDSNGPVNFNPARTGRIPKNKVERLLELYPFVRADIKKTELKNYASYNEACRSIDIMAKSMGEFDWIVTAPNELIKLNETLLNNDLFTTPPDIRSILADLVIFLAEMQNA